MINRFRLLRNIGQFDNVTATAYGFQRLTLLYAENGRGKTTLSALFRSLAQNRPDLILERHRLAAAHPPEAIIDCAGGAQPAIFKNGAWNRDLPNLTVFDDAFVDENVCSGLSVEAEHRQNLHELIIGAQGVALNQQLQGFVTRIEAHNAELRTRASAVPVAALGGMTIDAFCALQERPNIDADNRFVPRLRHHGDRSRADGADLLRHGTRPALRGHDRATLGVRGLRRFGVWRLFNAVMRVVSSLLGLLMVLMGGVWILQGLNLAWGSLSRSFMQGDQHWAFYGTILLLVGVAQVVWSNMRQAV